MRLAPISRQLFAQMRRNPHLKAIRRQRHRELMRQRALVAADERDLVREIRAVGYPITSIFDLTYQRGPGSAGLFRRNFRRRFSGPYPLAYPILARHLSLPHCALVRTRIASALRSGDTAEDVKQALLAAFNAEQDKDVRFSLATALYCSLGRLRSMDYPEIRRVRQASALEAFAPTEDPEPQGGLPVFSIRVHALTEKDAP